MKKTQTQIKTDKRAMRHRRIRAKVRGTEILPRLSVFRSNTGMYAQLIDDTKNSTLVAVHSRNVASGKPLEKAFVVGEKIAEQALSKKIKKAVFDRGGFSYTGRVKAVAEGARKGGLIF